MSIMDFAKYKRLNALLGSPNMTDVFVILALDHRDTLIADLQRSQVEPVTREDVIEFKRAVINALPNAYSLLLDPDYGLPALARAERFIKDDDGTHLQHRQVIAPLEVTDYVSKTQQMIPGWGVELIEAAGLEGAKLLLHCDENDPGRMARAIQLAEGAAEECERFGLPLFLEPITMREPTGEQVASLARQFAPYADVLKLQIPTDLGSLPIIHEACGTVPWTVLSGGVPFELFLEQAEAAYQAGASGVIAGRSVWGEAVALRGEERQAWLKQTADGRFLDLALTAEEHCRPAAALLPAPLLDDGWYKH